MIGEGRTWSVSLLLIALLAAVIGLSQSGGRVGGATQFNIVLQYDETDDGVDPCDPEPAHPTCGHNGDLASIMQAAAQHWETIIEDSHEILIRYRWVDVLNPSAEIVATDGDGRPTEAIVRFPVSFNYFYDPTPETDEEFDMRGRLYRTVHPDEQAEAFQGATPPAVFEVGYNGLEDEDISRDLLTFALHEIGHSLGLAGDVLAARPVAACTDADPWYDLDPVLTGDVDFELRAFAGTDCAHLDLGGITACKPPPGDQDATSSDPSTLPGLSIAECTAHQALFWFAEYPNSRARPSIADILSVAMAAGWEEINLPRKYSLGDTPGLWAEGETWLGNGVPDADDDVYIVNQETEPVVINSFEENGEARNITITDGNILNVFFFEFLVGNKISLQGEGTRLSADTSSLVDAFETVIGQGAMLDVPFNGGFDSFYIRNFGEIRGGDSNIDVVVLQNNGLIKANGGLLSFTSSSIDIPFDLDGLSANSQLQALAGDLSFDGKITDEVLSNIQIGPNHFITFVDGWTQQGSIVPSHLLTMTGGDFEATINGFSRLNGLLVVNQIARFTSDLEIEQFARVNFSVGGLEPGAGHDQLHVNGSVELDGEIIVELLPAFDPVPNNRYTLMTYASRSGGFSVETLPVLEGGLVLSLEYEETQLDLVVGFEGGEPGAPNCNGQAASTQAQEHGGMKNAAEFHGYPSVKAFQDAIALFCEG